MVFPAIATLPITSIESSDFGSWDVRSAAFETETRSIAAKIEAAVFGALNFMGKSSFSTATMRGPRAAEVVRWGKSRGNKVLLTPTKVL
jgi:hypothetical protein